MRFIYIWIFLAISFATGISASEPADSMSDFIETEMVAAKAPGLAYAVIEDGEVLSYAYGAASKGSDTPMTVDTPFVIASISKSFTAMAIMKLVEDGKIDLDSSILTYLSAFKNQPTGIITVRQLLSHTSGYSTKQGNGTDIDRRQDKDALQRQVTRIAQWKPHHAPDTRWQYSNANYLILGALIEQVSGDDYAHYIQSKILDPIGMTNSFVGDGEVYQNMADGHQPWFWTKRRLAHKHTDRVTAPMGGVIATASDLGLYLSVMLNDEDDIITAKSKSIMMQPASELSSFYGFGWYIDASNKTVSHSGLSPGIETLATLSPEKKKGVVILMNSNSGMGFGVNAALFQGITAKTLDLDFNNDANYWGTKSLLLMFMGLPLIFILAMIRLVFRREGLYAKSGISGAFSLWFPLLTTLALAWVCVYLIPTLFGVSLKSLYPYQPDFVIALIATAVTGVIWTLLRLGVFYCGRGRLN